MSETEPTTIEAQECPECWKSDQVVHIAVWVSDEDPPGYLLEWTCRRCDSSFYTER